MMADQRAKTWVAILIGAIVIVFVLVLALVGGSAYFVARHVHGQVVTADTAEAQFTSARDRFRGQVALVELRKDDDPIVHRPAEDARAARVENVRAMVYSADSRKLLNVSLPMWLLRMAPGKQFSFMSDDTNFDSRRIHLTLEDIDRHGPGLILDEHDDRGSRVLVWAE
jgi:uncharacterized membrane protein